MKRIARSFNLVLFILIYNPLDLRLGCPGCVRRYLGDILPSGPDSHSNVDDDFGGSHALMRSNNRMLLVGP